MSELQDEFQFPAPPNRALTIAPMLVSLFLVLLVFFIILNSISKVDEQKNDTVLNSINYAFSDGPPIPKRITPEADKSIELVANKLFDAIHTMTVARLVQLEDMKVEREGNTMAITVATDKLFNKGDIKIREEAKPFMDELAASLVAPRADLRVETEWLLGTKQSLFARVDEIDNNAVLRSGVIARALTERGLSPKSIVVGLATGDADEIVITFNVRSIDKAKLSPTIAVPVAPTATELEKAP